MKYEVILLPQAERDVQQIHNWIAERSPSGAAQWFNRFIEVLETLEARPDSCSLAPENEFVAAGRSIRQIIFKTRKGRRYRAVFTIVGDVVRVLHVRGFGQDLIEPDQF
jgi:plasmid stabilization system protein ParE